MSAPSTPLTLSEELRLALRERNILTTRSKMKVLKALSNLNQASHLQKMKELQEKTINEIFTSEVTYLRQLEIIMRFFMEPLRTKTWLPQSTFHALFGNIEILYRVNGELLQELKNNSENVGAAFDKIAPYLKLYSVYAYDYKQALQILQTMVKNDKELNEFIVRQEKRPEVATSLQSLLIVPIQRIPRYRLLLQELLNHTSPDDPHHTTIKDALKKIKACAFHINDLVTEYENAESMIALARRLSCVPVKNLITPGRKIVKQGSLMKVSKSGRTSHSRFLVLFTDSLMYCKGGEEGPLKFSCLFPLKHCEIEPVLSTGVFKITCQNEEILLYTADSQLGKEWISTLQSAVKEHQDCRRTLRKESSKRKPIRRKTLLHSTIKESPRGGKTKEPGCFSILKRLR